MDTFALPRSWVLGSTSPKPEGATVKPSIMLNEKVNPITPAVTSITTTDMSYFPSTSFAINKKPSTVTSCKGEDWTKQIVYELFSDGVSAFRQCRWPRNWGQTINPVY